MALMNLSIRKPDLPLLNELPAATERNEALRGGDSLTAGTSICRLP